MELNFDFWYQVFLLLIALLYKYLLSKENVWGWILGATSSLFSGSYMGYHMHLYIVMSLEAAFILLSIYGAYKWKKENKKLTRVDFTIITLASIVILYLFIKQIQSHTVWYEALSSVCFLSGVIFLAQESKKLKVAGWILFFWGSVAMGFIFIQNFNKALPLVMLHVTSLGIALWAIRKLWKQIKHPSFS